MKKMLLFFVVTVFSASLFAQDAPAAKKAEDIIKFKTTTHNFGKIKQGVPVNFDFLFSNASEKPVVVEYAQATCGCTTPVWPQAPVSKGKTDKITAGFNAAAAGPFTKQITVKLAGVDVPVILTITGEVLTGEEFVKYTQSKPTKG